MNDNEYVFRTPVLRKRWFVVGALSIRVLTVATNATLITENSSVDAKITKTDKEITETSFEINTDVCRTLNEQKSIVDSGTTNIRLPDELFRKVCVFNFFNFE